MFTLRPHTLFFSLDSTPDDPVYDPATGNMVDPAPATPVAYELPCRLEPREAQAGSKTIVSEDGAEIVYSFEVYLNNDAPRIEAGTLITVKDGDYEIGSGTVKREYKGQLVTRLWV